MAHCRNLQIDRRGERTTLDKHPATDHILLQ